MSMMSMGTNQLQYRDQPEPMDDYDKAAKKPSTSSQRAVSDSSAGNGGRENIIQRISRRMWRGRDTSRSGHSPTEQARGGPVATQQPTSSGHYHDTRSLREGPNFYRNERHRTSIPSADQGYESDTAGAYGRGRHHRHGGDREVPEGRGWSRRYSVPGAGERQDRNSHAFVDPGRGGRRLSRHRNDQTGSRGVVDDADPSAPPPPPVKDANVPADKQGKGFKRLRRFSLPGINWGNRNNAAPQAPAQNAQAGGTNGSRRCHSLDRREHPGLQDRHHHNEELAAAGVAVLGGAALADHEYERYRRHHHENPQHMTGANLVSGAGNNQSASAGNGHNNQAAAPPAPTRGGAGDYDTRTDRRGRRQPDHTGRHAVEAGAATALAEHEWRKHHDGRHGHHQYAQQPAQSQNPSQAQVPMPSETRDPGPTTAPASSAPAQTADAVPTSSSGRRRRHHYYDDGNDNGHSSDRDHRGRHALEAAAVVGAAALGEHELREYERRHGHGHHGHGQNYGQSQPQVQGNVPVNGSGGGSASSNGSAAQVGSAPQAAAQPQMQTQMQAQPQAQTAAAPAQANTSSGRRRAYSSSRAAAPAANTQPAAGYATAASGTTGRAVRAVPAPAASAPQYTQAPAQTQAAPGTYTTSRGDRGYAEAQPTTGARGTTTQRRSSGAYDRSPRAVPATQAAPTTQATQGQANNNTGYNYYATPSSGYYLVPASSVSHGYPAATAQGATGQTTGGRARAYSTGGNRPGNATYDWPRSAGSRPGSYVEGQRGVPVVARSAHGY